MNTDSTEISNDDKQKLQRVKQLKITHLEDEIKLLKSQLKSSTTKDIMNELPSNRLNGEIHNLEVKIVQQIAAQQRLEDRHYIVYLMFRNACKRLENSHIEVMDAEELDYMREIIENKKNELMSQRNFITEIQKIGWENLPIKFADECRKTQLELNFIESEVKKCKDDVEENISKLRESSEELAKIQKVYNEKKKLNNKLEKEIEDLVDELASLNTVIHAKQGTAEELEKVVKEIESEIKKTMIAREKSTKEELEIIEKKKERQKLERQKGNKDLEDLEKNQKQLLKEFQNQEDDLRKKKTILKEYKYAARKTRNYNFNDLRHEYEMLVGEIDKMKIDQQAEAKLKMEYFNMLQDMLGKMKIICRISLPSDDSDKTFYFDHIYVPKSQNQDVLEAVDYLYEKANIGFNCYIVTMGGTKSGKTHLMLGPKKDGIIWLGLDKIKDVLIKNRKDHLQTRFFVCSVEMTDNQIFDLLSGEIKNKAEIKQDAFKMTLFSNVNYKECFAEDEIRKLLKTAVGNRQKASTSLKSKSTSFIFLVTFQVFNKHQHRYWKGKITHIKLACLNSMKSLNEELYNFIKGKDINYKRNLITQLLQDGFGGNAKTCIIGTINPSKKNLKETTATLKMVSGFRKCSNEIEIHSETEKVYSLKNDIERLLRGVKIENICP